MLYQVEIPDSRSLHRVLKTVSLQVIPWSPDSLPTMQGSLQPPHGSHMDYASKKLPSITGSPQPPHRSYSNPAQTSQKHTLSTVTIGIPSGFIEDQPTGSVSHSMTGPM